MMLPPAWENNDQLDPDVKAFYEYNNTLIEPWDGPAHIIFTDGTQVGALLDRNGFRPGRWQLTDNGYVVLASEAGVLPEIAEEHIVSKGRLEPGKMFLVDTDEGRIIPDEEIKKNLASQHPYRKWVEGNSVEMSQLPKREHVNHSGQSVQRRQRAFGYTEEDLKLLLTPMANTGKEPLGSMGNDAPLPRCPSAAACCSTTSPRSSRRSPTRRWTGSVRRSSPRSNPPSVPSRTCWPIPSCTPRRSSSRCRCSTPTRWHSSSASTRPRSSVAITSRTSSRAFTRSPAAARH